MSAPRDLSPPDLLTAVRGAVLDRLLDEGRTIHAGDLTRDVRFTTACTGECGSEGALICAHCESGLPNECGDFWVDVQRLLDERRVPVASCPELGTVVFTHHRNLADWALPSWARPMEASAP